MAKKNPLPYYADQAVLQRATSNATDYFSSGDFDEFLKRVDIQANKFRANMTREIGESKEQFNARRASEASSGRNAPLQVTRGERVAATLVLEGGKVCEVTERRGWGGDSAFIDWLNITMADETFSGEWHGTDVVTDDQLILDCSALCESLFGFGITKQREKGANFYKRSYVLGDGYGMVCHGGQRNSLLISLSGEGCMAAKDGWEMRTFNFLRSKAVAGKITRADLAHDIFDGVAYEVDRALADYKSNLFNAGGRTPDCECRGNWERPNGKGRSFYVGHRTNGKYARFYEKGKHLGDASSPWVRAEVEFKSVDRIIPFDVLIRAGEYLAAAYPAIGWISKRAERIETKKKTASTNYETMMAWLHRQCGAALWAASVVEGSAENVLAKLVQVGKVPARLSVPDFNCSAEFIHHKEKSRERLPLAMVVGEAEPPSLFPPYSAAF